MDQLESWRVSFLRGTRVQAPFAFFEEQPQGVLEMPLDLMPFRLIPKVLEASDVVVIRKEPAGLDSSMFKLGHIQSIAKNNHRQSRSASRHDFLTADGQMGLSRGIRHALCGDLARGFPPSFRLASTTKVRPSTAMVQTGAPPTKCSTSRFDR